MVYQLIKKNVNQYYLFYLKEIKPIQKKLKKKLDQKQKIYPKKKKKFVIYLWICNNFQYDEGLYSGKEVSYTPRGAFTKEKTVCEGFSRLFLEIASYIGLTAQFVTGFAKGYGYEPGDKMKTSNHAYNAIKLDNKWYLLNVTWGVGKIEDKNL